MTNISFKCSYLIIIIYNNQIYFHHETKKKKIYLMLFQNIIYRRLNARRSWVTFWVKLSCLHLLEVEANWYILSYSAGLSSQSIRIFMEETRCQKKKKYKRNLSMKLLFPLKEKNALSTLLHSVDDMTRQRCANQNACILSY